MNNHPNPRDIELGATRSETKSNRTARTAAITIAAAFVAVLLAGCAPHPAQPVLVDSFIISDYHGTDSVQFELSAQPAREGGGIEVIGTARNIIVSEIDADGKNNFVDVYALADGDELTGAWSFDSEVFRITYQIRRSDDYLMSYYEDYKVVTDSFGKKTVTTW